MQNNQIAVRYYNIMIYITIEKGKEFLLPYLQRLINRQDGLSLRMILNWCKNQGMEYRTIYKYRKDFPLRANLLNWLFYHKVLRDMEKE